MKKLQKVMGICLKIFLFLSSYIPLFIMVFLNSMNQISIISIVKTWNLNPTLWIIFLVISFLSIVIFISWLYRMKKTFKGKSPISIKNLTLNDSSVLNFFVTFIVPIISLKPESWPSVISNLILLIIEGIFFISNNTLYFNILLIFCGYHIYSFVSDNNRKNIVITKCSLKDQTFNDVKGVEYGTTNIYYAEKIKHK